MTEPLDHAKEAERLLDSTDARNDLTGHATTHALLALVEQHREIAIGIGALNVMMTQMYGAACATAEQLKRVADAMDAANSKRGQFVYDASTFTARETDAK